MKVERRSFLASLWAGLSVVLFGKPADNYQSLRDIMAEPLVVDTWNPPLHRDVYGIALEDTNKDGLTNVARLS